MNVLLDTCVVSELQRPHGNANVRGAIQSLDSDQLFLSVVAIGEIAKGIALLDSGRRRTELGAWLSQLQHQFDEQILPIDRDTARVWGELTARAQRTGMQIPASDGLVAATALQHGLSVMTRNTKHFAATGAIIVDPWESQPD